MENSLLGPTPPLFIWGLILPHVNDGQDLSNLQTLNSEMKQFINTKAVQIFQDYEQSPVLKDFMLKTGSIRPGLSKPLDKIKDVFNQIKQEAKHLHIFILKETRGSSMKAISAVYLREVLYRIEIERAQDLNNLVRYTVLSQPLKLPNFKIFLNNLNKQKLSLLEQANKIRDWMESGENQAELNKILDITYPSHEPWRKLKEISPEITYFLKLKNLLITDQEINHLPSELFQLSNLTLLGLSRNKLQEVPPDIQKLSKLTKLFLDGNQFTNFPNEILTLTQLEKLNVSSNQIPSIPDEIDNLKEICDLDLSNNQLTTLPSSIGSLCQDPETSSFSIGKNPITHLPRGVANSSTIRASIKETYPNVPLTLTQKVKKFFKGS